MLCHERRTKYNYSKVNLRNNEEVVMFSVSRAEGKEFEAFNDPCSLYESESTTTSA